MKHYIKTTMREFLNENLSEYQLNNILDKISKYGVDSLSNFERTLLRSHNDPSIDIDIEIEKHNNKYKEAKNIIKDIPLQVEDEELENHIGRYVRYVDKENRGLYAKLGMIYEIVSIQKHWGYIDGKYVFGKIGFRIAQVGKDNDFGRVGDVDEVEFIDISEEEAIEKNKQIMDIVDSDIN